MTPFTRRMPVGAEVQPRGGVHFRVWAPERKSVEVVADGERTAMEREEGGYFRAHLPGAGPGTLYKYRLDGGDSYPDPASRFQPRGPHGESEVIDPESYRWRDTAWKGLAIEGQVIYEMHVGAFTAEGTWEAASGRLEDLASTGITVLEVMPVAEFPGRYGWGYDGVDLFAPVHLYGRPDQMRGFVERAHELGMAVILDVVYNHVGPDGNYLKQFSRFYFTDRYECDWGEALNFDGEGSAGVREFYEANAGYWIDEFHLDGLRLDATQQVFDSSGDHILRAVTRRVRQAAGGRRTIVVGENEPQDTKLVRPADRGGYELDALWNDDFHHSAMAALTGRNEAYYTDYLGKAQEFVSAVKWGCLYQGQRYKWQAKRRGKPGLDLAPAAFVLFTQNHDQIANSGRGLRCHQLTDPGRNKAMTALMLLAPGTPMLFMGQEFNSSAPFLYFADLNGELAGPVRDGRREFLWQFRSLRTPEMESCFVDPVAADTFSRCKLDHGERERNRQAVELHRDLIRLRRSEPAFAAQTLGAVDGAVLGPEAFVLRFFGTGRGRVEEHRLLLVNLGLDLHFDPAPEPLLAPPEGMEWKVLWSSEDPGYGGCGTPPPDGPDNWRVPGHAAVVLKPAAEGQDA